MSQTCSSCGVVQIVGRRYCHRCGALAVSAEPGPGLCGRCGFANDPGHAYCGGCGLVMADGAEWRQLSVMFCDLADSTAMSAKLDPERLRDVNRAYQEAVTAAIEHYGGFVARYMGDGVLAYFGYPHAHGDDPVRAAHAGLDAIERMAELQRSLGAKLGVELAVRVGIATGKVVVGDLIGTGAAQEAAVVGTTPNLAARLQAVAGKNAVMVDPATSRRVTATFEVHSRGEHTLKGIPEPIEVFEVGAARVPAAAEVEALVGRETELAWLEGLWRESSGRRPAVALIGAEAGMGKSHLVRGFAAGKPSVWIAGSAWHQSSALHPLASAPWLAPRTRELMRWLLGGDEDKVSDAESRMRELVEGLVDDLLALADQPLLVVIEDAHWLDPTTLRWLGRLIEGLGRAPLMLLVSHRPEFEAPWAGERIHRLDLQRIADTGVRGLIDAIAGAQLPPEVVRHVVDQTGGIPLYVTELTRTLVDSGHLVRVGDRFELHGDLDDLEIPDTLRGSLTARLDQLGFVKALAQTASAFGRSFPRGLLAEVSDLSPAELDVALERLVDAHVVDRDGASFVFRHALLQEAAYDGMLRTRRSHLHGRIADVLAATGQASAEALAHHLSEAGRVDAAVEQWVAAASQSASRFALVEAVAHLRRALAVALTAEPGDVDREVGLRIQLAAQARLVEGDQTAIQALERAQELAEEHQLHARLSEIHFHRGNVLFIQGDLERCTREHEQARRYAEQVGSRRLLAEALGGLGDASYLRGRMRAACGLFRECARLLEQEGAHERAAANRVLVGWAELYVDDLDVARAALEASHRECERLALARPLMVACGGLSTVYAEQGDAEGALQHARQARALAAKFGSVAFESAGEFYLGRAAELQGDFARARARYEECLSIAAARDGLAFWGAGVNARIAMLEDDPARKRELVDRGEALLSISLGHSSLHFHVFALEVAVQLREPERLERYAQGLERTIGDERTVWAIFHIQRARALLAAQAGTSPELRADLEEVLRMGEVAGYGPALDAVRDALGRVSG